MSAIRPRFALALLAGSLIIAACSADTGTGPRQLKPTSLRADEDTFPDPLCKSGYITSAGKCTGET
jgi:hypothetical protein